MLADTLSIIGKCLSDSDLSKFIRTNKYHYSLDKEVRNDNYYLSMLLELFNVDKPLRPFNVSNESFYKSLYKMLHHYSDLVTSENIILAFRYISNVDYHRFLIHLNVPTTGNIKNNIVTIHYMNDNLDVVDVLLKGGFTPKNVLNLATSSPSISYVRVLFDNILFTRSELTVILKRVIISCEEAFKYIVDRTDFELDIEFEYAVLNNKIDAAEYIVYSRRLSEGSLGYLSLQFCLRCCIEGLHLLNKYNLLQKVPLASLPLSREHNKNIVCFLLEHGKMIVSN